MFVTCLRRYHSFKLSFFLSESNPCIYKDRNYRENVLTCRCWCYCYHWRQEQEESHNFSGRLSRKNIWNRFTVIQSVFVTFRTSECHRTDDKKNIVRRHNLANCFIEEQFVFRAGCQNYSCHVVSRTWTPAKRNFIFCVWPKWHLHSTGEDEQDFCI